MSTGTILLVDDDPSILTVWILILEMAGYDVLSAETGLEGLKLLASTRVDLAILDYVMPDMDGLQLAQIIRQRNPELPIMMLSGSLPPADRTADLVDVCIAKTCDPNYVLQQVEYLGQRSAALLARRQKRPA